MMEAAKKNASIPNVHLKKDFKIDLSGWGETTLLKPDLY